MGPPLRRFATSALRLVGVVAAAVALARCAAVSPTATQPLELGASVGPCQAPLPLGQPVLLAPGAVGFAAVDGDCRHREATARFLTGCSLGESGEAGGPCGAPFPLHVPASAPVRDLHAAILGSDVQPYFVDANRGGADADATYGLESAQVVLFAGHGGPNHLLVRPEENTLALDELKLGDGAARYLFLLSCGVMAHGPKSCGGQGPAALFGCPQSYAPGAGQQNVFARWLPRLGPHLRMVCGGSTKIEAAGAPSRFWTNHLLHGLPVADSFLRSLAVGAQVPLCLTRGGADPRRTPLADEEFESTANPDGDNGPFLYALYPVRDTPGTRRASQQLLALAGARDAPPPPLPPVRAHWLPPVLRLAATPIPRTLLDEALATQGELGFGEVSAALALGAGAPPLPLAQLRLRVHPRSAGLVASWQLGGEGDAAPDATPEAELDALRALTGGFGLGAAAPPLGEPVIVTHRHADTVTLQLDRVPVDASSSAQPRCWQTCTYAELQASVTVAGRGGGVVRRLPIFGDGAQWLLGRCPRGTSSTGGSSGSCPAAGRGEAFLSVVDRQVLGEVEENDKIYRRPGRTAEEARAEAWQLLASRDGRPGNAARYGRPQYAIGYLAAPIHCVQQRLMPVHRFSFFAREPEERGHPVVIDVPVYGERGDEQREWDCASPPA